MESHAEQSAERSDGAGGDHVELAANILDFRGMDRDSIRQAGHSNGFLEEGGAEAAGLDQADRASNEGGDDDAGEAGAGTNVDPGGAGVGLEADELRGVEDVALPDVVEGRCGDQVLAVI